jgi:predicted amidophosphoribosyltransferase
VLLASTCPVCGLGGPSPCARCAAGLRPAPPLPPPPGLDACWCLLSYEGAGRELVARLKYRNHRIALPGLGAALAALVPTPVVADVVTWAPTTAARRRARGFDHAELLAREVGRRTRWPVRRMLDRRGAAQTGRSRQERLGGPVMTAARACPPVVVVVDDVVTSGATMTAASAALRARGAAVVLGLAAARTAPPEGPPPAQADHAE